MQYLKFFLLPFCLALFITPLVRKFAIKNGFVAYPRPDRWHKEPTALLGGIGIYLASAFAVLFLGLANKNVGPNGEEPVLTEEQSAECKVELEKEAVLQKERRYQNDMLSSTLMILIASVVLTIHLKLVKPR